MAKRKPSPSALASRFADHWLTRVVANMDEDRPTKIVETPLEAIVEVQWAVLAMEGYPFDKDGFPILPDAPDAVAVPYVRNIDAAQRAGYLVGVQVGLRLRAQKGGA